MPDFPLLHWHRGAAVNPTGPNVQASGSRSCWKTLCGSRARTKELLKLIRGTFSPYTEGTKTNVIFFTKGRPTERTWIYDARSNVPKITKKSRPLSPKHFAEFEKCYGKDPNGLSKRSEVDSSEHRWRSFTIHEVKDRHYKLDAFKWLRDEELDDPDELLVPEELITGAMEELQLALDDLADIQKLLEGNGNGGPA